MFHNIIFFTSDTHHQSKVKISTFTPDMVMVWSYWCIIWLLFRKIYKIYAHTKSYMSDKHRIERKNFKTWIFHILLLAVFLVGKHLLKKIHQKGGQNMVKFGCLYLSEYPELKIWLTSNIKPHCLNNFAM